jgi:heat shock protein HslJ
MKSPIVIAALLASACAMSDPNLSQRSGTPAYSGAGLMPPTLAASASDLTSRPWHWQRTEIDGRTIVAAAPDRYTLTFEGGGRVLVRADCNRGSGSYEVNGPSMRLGPAALTRVGCPPGTQDNDFVQPLVRVTGYQIADGELVLALGGSGSMRFKAAM